MANSGQQTSGEMLGYRSCGLLKSSSSTRVMEEGRHRERLYRQVYSSRTTDGQVAGSGDVWSCRSVGRRGEFRCDRRAVAKASARVGRFGTRDIGWRLSWEDAGADQEKGRTPNAKMSGRCHLREVVWSAAFHRRTGSKRCRTRLWNIVLEPLEGCRSLGFRPRGSGIQAYIWRPEQER